MSTSRKIALVLSVMTVLSLLLAPAATESTENFSAEEISRQGSELQKLEEVTWQPAEETTWQAHAEDGMVEALIMLEEQADTMQKAAEVKMQHDYSKDDLAKAVVGSLQETAEKTQAPLIEELAALELDLLGDQPGDKEIEIIEEFFVVNVLHAKVPLELIEEIEALPGVDKVKPNQRIELVEPVESKEAPGPSEDDHLWNLEHVNAPGAWEKGFDGKGVVVGIIDTGVELEHEMLAHSYRGFSQEEEPDHAYNWFDPVYGEPAPGDLEGHGTHVTGTILGASPGREMVTGVAPGAEWIAARVFCVDESATTAEMLQAGQFFIAPTPYPDGSGEPDPTKAPDIVNNSWSFVDQGIIEIFRPMVINWQAAGVLPVFSAGNSGPGYGSVNSPANHPESLAIAATDEDKLLAPFSSRGPIPYPHPDHLQPDLSAPGVDIISAYPGNEYASLEGTSMAAPHVAGAAALLMQQDPDLEPGSLANMLINSADPLTDDIYLESPNYGFGYGLLDSLAALDADDGRPEIPVELDFLLPPLVDDAYVFTSLSLYPQIPLGPATLQIPEGIPGAIDVNYDLNIYGSEFIEDNWYAIGYDQFGAPFSLYTICTETGDPTEMGPVEPAPQRIFTGLAYDPAGETLYASAFSQANEQFQSKLFTVDLDTGEATLIDTIDGVDEIIYGIAADAEGNLYGAEMTEDLPDDDYLYSICQETAEAEEIGPLGFEGAIGSIHDGHKQDLAYDRDNETLYGLLSELHLANDYYLQEFNLYELDIEDGEAQAILPATPVFGSLAIPEEKYEVPSPPIPDPGAEYSVEVAVEQEDRGTAEGDGNFDYHDIVTVEAEAAEGYQFDSWTEDGEVVSTSEKYLFQITGDRNLVANFIDEDPDQHEVTLSANPEEGGEVDGAGKYNTGDEVIVVAFPHEGYSFENWTENEEVVSTSEEYRFEIDSDRELVANFKQKANTLFWQHSEGDLSAWHMDKEKRFAHESLSPNNVDPAWEIKGVVDANRNDHPDIYFYNRDEGEAKLWLMEGLDKVETVEINNPADDRDDIDTAWEMMAVYDLDGSGEPDIIWQALEGENKGHLAAWMMEDQEAYETGRIENEPEEPFVNPAWEIGAVFDLLGDGEPEIIWQAGSGEYEDELAYWKVDMDETLRRIDSARIYNEPEDPSFDADWQLNASVDLFVDGTEEFLFQHIDGSLAYWQLDVDDPKEVIRDKSGRLEPESLADIGWNLTGAAMLADPPIPPDQDQ